jgi:hypothetical protein
LILVIYFVISWSFSFLWIIRDNSRQYINWILIQGRNNVPRDICKDFREPWVINKDRKFFPLDNAVVIHLYTVACRCLVSNFCLKCLFFICNFFLPTRYSFRTIVAVKILHLFSRCPNDMGQFFYHVVSNPIWSILIFLSLTLSFLSLISLLQWAFITYAKNKPPILNLI